MLEKQIRRLAGADGEILLHFRALLAAKGRIGQHDMVAVFLLNVGEVFRERIGMDDVRRVNAVQDHVHDPDHVGERLLFFAVESALLQDLVLGSRAIWIVRLQVIMGFAQEPQRPAGAVIDPLTDSRLYDLDHCPFEGAWGVILSAIAPGVAHALYLLLIKLRQFVLLRLGAEAQLVNMLDDLAQVVAALNLVLNLAEDFPDLVFDGVGAAGSQLEAVQVGEELLVDEVLEVVAGQGGVVIELAILALGRGPGFPAVGFVEQVGVFLAVQRGLIGAVLLQPIEVFQEQQPGGLLGVIQLGGAAGLFPEDVVYVSEGLFKHGGRGWGRGKAEMLKY